MELNLTWIRISAVMPFFSYTAGLKIFMNKGTRISIAPFTNFFSYTKKILYIKKKFTNIIFHESLLIVNFVKKIFSSPMSLHPHYSRQMNSFCTSKICIMWTLLFPTQLLCFWVIFTFIPAERSCRLMFTRHSRAEKRTWSSSKFFGAY